MPFPVLRSCVLASAGLLASAAFAQSPDFAEGNAPAWSTFASDNAAASVVNAADHLKDGAASLLFTTQSGFDTGVKYPASGNLNYNASAFNYLTFWEYPENSTPIGWQGDQPIVVIRTGSGVITLTPTSQLTPKFAWKLFKVPLAGGDGWTRSQTGTPNLADVDQIEIHHDTWDYAFRIWIDGVRFRQLDPAGLPPPGPPPPAGVDPDVVVSRIYLYIFDPIMENFGSRRMHQVYGWQDPVTLTQQVKADMLASSHGRAKFEIIETVVADEYPRFADGFQHDDATFAADWNNHVFHNAQFDYVGFCDSHQLAERVDAGEFDEIWLYAPPIAGMWESCMAGRNAYWVNGPTYPAAGRERAFVIMGWNFERGVGEAIHSWGHRSESIMAHIYGQWCQTRCNTWSRFALLDQNVPGQGGVGNVHFPVNGQSDYDYANPRFVQSNADAWLTYPTLNNNTRSFNFHEWSPNGVDPQREYLNWWYSHMPHVASRGGDGYLANWWRYLMDVDQFKNGGGDLRLTLGQPTVTLVAPAPGQSVSGRVRVLAAAEVDGALGRVDFYVDGVYAASDYMSPYVIDWTTTGLAAGTHTLQARAYELQNGTEGVSAIITVNVLRCDPDVNQDGNADQGDVDYLINAVAGGGNPTGIDPDFNHDGNVDQGDVDALIDVVAGGNCP